MNAIVQDPLAVRTAWRELRGQRLRQRDIALRLEISEAELLASRVGVDRADVDGPHVIRLDASPTAIDGLINGLGGLGTVMALTRNESCVHEKDGPYVNIDLAGHAGLVLGREIDLRLFHRRWRFAFALEEQTPHGTQRSLQFYLGDGSATHKVFLRPASDLAAWRGLVEKWRSASQDPEVSIEPLAQSDYLIAESPDLDAFRAQWLAMTDTHQFFGLLRKHGLARTAALRAAPPGYSRQVDNSATTTMLGRAADSGLPIMVFVANRGCIQIHSGPVHKVAPMGSWINVLDPGFNLHLRTDAIHESWCVTKPTEDGPVNSLEVYDRDGNAIATFFGERKPGRPELAGWPALLNSLPAVS